MCKIFGVNWFFNKLVWIWISIFLNILFLVHTCMAFRDVLDIAEATFRQKTLKKDTELLNAIHFTIFDWKIDFSVTATTHSLSLSMSTIVWSWTGRSSSSCRGNRTSHCHSSEQYVVHASQIMYCKPTFIRDKFISRFTGDKLACGD